MNGTYDPPLSYFNCDLVKKGFACYMLCIYTCFTLWVCPSKGHDTIKTLLCIIRCYHYWFRSIDWIIKIMFLFNLFILIIHHEIRGCGILFRIVLDRWKKNNVIFFCCCVINLRVWKLEWSACRNRTLLLFDDNYDLDLWVMEYICVDDREWD